MVVVFELDWEVVLRSQDGKMVSEVGQVECLFVEDSIVEVVLRLDKRFLHGETDVDGHAVLLLDGGFQTKGSD